MEEKQGVLKGVLVSVNVGIALFDESYEKQGVKYIKVNWKPQEQASEKTKSLLSKLL